MPDRPKIVTTSGGLSARPTNEKDLKAYPEILNWLCDDTWADGTARTRSSILFFVQDGAIKGCLMNKDDEMSLWAGGDSFAGFLACLEGRLKDPKADWRKMANHPSKRKGK